MSATTPGSMTVECGRCGHVYRPSKEAIIAGIWRRACPVCYPPNDEKEAA